MHLDLQSIYKQLFQKLYKYCNMMPYPGKIKQLQSETMTK